MSDEQPRNGGRFAPKAKPEPEPPARIPTPAHDEFAAMAAKRRASPGGFVVEPPVPIEKLNKIGQVRHGVAIGHDRQELRSIDLVQALYDWLREVAREGLPGDLELAWMAWQPPVSNVKMHHRSIYDELQPQCLHRAGQLGMQREKECQALRAEWHKQQAIEAARADVAETEKQLADEVPAELVRRRAYLADLEAAA